MLQRAHNRLIPETPNMESIDHGSLPTLAQLYLTQQKRTALFYFSSVLVVNQESLTSQ